MFYIIVAIFIFVCNWRTINNIKNAGGLPLRYKLLFLSISLFIIGLNIFGDVSYYQKQLTQFELISHVFYDVVNYTSWLMLIITIFRTKIYKDE